MDYLIIDCSKTLLTRHLHVVVGVDAVVGAEHQAPVVAAVLQLHVGDHEIGPAVAYSDGDPPPQQVAGVALAIQQLVAAARVELAAGLGVVVVQRQEGQPQHQVLELLDGLLASEARRENQEHEKENKAKLHLDAAACTKCFSGFCFFFFVLGKVELLLALHPEKRKNRGGRKGKLWIFLLQTSIMWEVRTENYSFKNVKRLHYDVTPKTCLYRVGRKSHH